MKLHFLAAADGTRLSKKFVLQSDQVKKYSYPNVYEFNSFALPVNNTQQFAAAIRSCAQKGMCLSKGAISKPLVEESRAGKTSATEETQWLCLDVDGLPGIRNAEDFVAKVLPAEFENVSYVEQLSSSAGFSESGDYNGHLFFMLSQPVTPGVLKNWTKHLNLTVSLLEENLELARNNLVLKWKLDISVNQNDKLIYIADPECEGIDDPMSDERISHHQKDKETVDLNFESINPGVLSQKEIEKVNTLREKLGLPKKQATYRTQGDMTYLANVEEQVLYGEPFEERGFVYLPMSPNNRHSYYHPVGKPEFIFSFKGEPPMRTRDALPEYYRQVACSGGLTQEEREVDTQILLFRAIEQDSYYEIRWSEEDGVRDVYKIGSKEKLMDRANELNLPRPDPVPSWNMIYSPPDKTTIDREAKIINRFRPSRFMTEARKLDEVPEIPPTINWILDSALGGCPETKERFLNWVAVKFQTRGKAGTSWVLQGTTGTGKGVLFHRILRPLFGSNNTAMKTKENLEEKYNEFMETKLLVAIDEIEMHKANKTDMALYEKLKNVMSEPVLPIRGMRENPREVDNYVDLLFYSNRYTPVVVEPEDRRLNICPRQETSIKGQFDPETHLAQIEEELSDFADYLMTREASAYLASQPLFNKAREIAVRNSMTLSDQFCNALHQGDMDFFQEYILSTPNQMLLGLASQCQKHLEEWVKRYKQHLNGGGPAFVCVDELLDVYSMIKGQRLSPKAFGTLLSTHGLPADIQTRPRVNGRQRRSYKIEWDIDEVSLQSICRDLGIHNEHHQPDQQRVSSPPP